MVDRRGHQLGSAEPYYRYTVGQRRGLGIAGPEPRYVLSIDPERNTITAGGRADIYAAELTAGDINWVSGKAPVGPMVVHAQVRYRHPAALATVVPAGAGEAIVTFREPQMAPAPGQAVVFYDGDAVVGGGIIARVKTKVVS